MVHPRQRPQRRSAPQPRTAPTAKVTHHAFETPSRALDLLFVHAASTRERGYRSLSQRSPPALPRPIGSEVTRARNYSHSSGHDAIIRGCYEGVTYEIFPNTFSTNTLIAYLPSLSSDVTRARDDVGDTETTFRARDDVGDA